MTSRDPFLQTEILGLLGIAQLVGYPEYSRPYPIAKHLHQLHAPKGLKLRPKVQAVSKCLHGLVEKGFAIRDTQGNFILTWAGAHRFWAGFYSRVGPSGTIELIERLREVSRHPVFPV